MDLTSILENAVSQDVSDIFIVAGMPVTYKIQGNLVKIGDQTLNNAMVADYVGEIYRLSDNRATEKLQHGDDDFSFSIPGVSRFRVSAYKQRGTLAAVIRVVRLNPPDPAAMGIPDSIIRLSQKNKGMILVTGPAGSGKSTTLACMIDHINRTRQGHIITLEDPLEYLHRHNKSIVSQREINSDTDDYLKALRAALRQAPDVILLGEMRDYETIMTAMTAAETGHLMLSSLHTLGVANTIDRIVDVFPANQQHQIRVQLSMVLQVVISQQLVPSLDGSIIPVFEVMVTNNAIKNMIRESKVHQIDTVIQSSSAEGMVTMDNSLIALVNAGKISRDAAIEYAVNPEIMAKKLN